MSDAKEAARRIVEWADAPLSEWDRYSHPLESVCSPDDVIDVARAYLDALAEIERLRAELVEERHTILELQSEFLGPLPSGRKTRREAEIERLRDTLEECRNSLAAAKETEG